MFGTLRLLLAFLVALSHAGRTLYGINQGLSAVIVFFIISGYVMTGLLRTHYKEPKSIIPFYCDRAIRIYPQFLLFLFLTILFVRLTGFRAPNIAGDISAKNLISSVLLIPLDFVMLSGLPFLSGLFNLHQYLLIHPAWSLGLEVQFYILIPFILLAKARSEVIWASFTIFAFAAFQFLAQDTFCYFFIFGVLFIFLSGSLLYDYNHGNKQAGVFLGAIYLCATLLSLACLYGGTLANYSSGAFIGYLCGMPLVFLLSKLRRHSLDEWMGNISYGMFLCHVLVINSAKQFNWFAVSQHLSIYFLCIFALGSAGYYLVERPILKYRKKLRARKDFPRERAMADTA